MPKGDNLKFQGGAATNTEGEQANQGRKNRDHAHDGRAATQKSLGSPPIRSFEQGQVKLTSRALGATAGFDPIRTSAANEQHMLEATAPLPGCYSLDEHGGMARATDSRYKPEETAMTQAEIEAELKSLREHVSQLQQQQEDRKTVSLQAGIGSLILAIGYLVSFMINLLFATPVSGTPYLLTSMPLVLFGSLLIVLGRRTKPR
jgi:hypothetical protein